MSINSLAGASIGGASPISGLIAPGSASAQPQSAAEKAKAKADASAAAQKAMLDAIKQKGIYAWAQEEKMAALKAKIRAQVLADQHQSEDDLAKLDPTARKTAETAIQEEIARRIKEAMQESMEGQAKQAAKDGKPPKPMIIDISV